MKSFGERLHAASTRLAGSSHACRSCTKIWSEHVVRSGACTSARPGCTRVSATASTPRARVRTRWRHFSNAATAACRSTSKASPISEMSVRLTLGGAQGSTWVACTPLPPITISSCTKSCSVAWHDARRSEVSSATSAPSSSSSWASSSRNAGTSAARRGSVSALSSSRKRIEWRWSSMMRESRAAASRRSDNGVICGEADRRASARLASSLVAMMS